MYIYIYICIYMYASYMCNTSTEVQPSKHLSTKRRRVPQGRD